MWAPSCKRSQRKQAKTCPFPVHCRIFGETGSTQMRNLIYGINLTVDGCCDHTKLIADDEIHEYYAHLMRDVDVLIFGRKTYQLMVPFWPDVAKNHSGQTKAMNEFAQAFDAVN